MTIQASGTFQVKLSPQAPGTGEEPGVGRLLLDKQFSGDLKAVSAGQMLSVGTGVEGSAGYVALERVSGSLHGRQGTFALQHNGTLNRGTPELSIRVVPDSGTGELTGLNGEMTLDQSGGGHAYTLRYTLPTTDPA